MTKNHSRLIIWYGVSALAAGVLLIFYIFIYSAPRSPADIESARESYNDPDASSVEIIDFEYWVSIQTDLWWRYAYRLRLRNNSDIDIDVRAGIRYFNSDGAVVDSTTTNILTVPAGEEKRFSGHSLISVPSAREVDSAEITIRNTDPQ
jgi:hypothetical protein